MTSKLESILSERRVRGSEQYTHINPSRSIRYNLSGADLASFWKEYIEVIDTNWDCDLHIAERVKEHNHIIADCTLNFVNFDMDNYTTSFALAVAGIYQDVIDECYDLREQWYSAGILLESNVPEESSAVRFSIHFPYIKVDIAEFEDIVKPKIINKLRSENVLAMLESQPTNDWDSIIKPLVDRSGPLPQFLYGSTRDGRDRKLFFHGVIPPSINRYDIESVDLTDFDLAESFKHTNHRMFIGDLPKDSFNDLVAYESTLALILSVDYWSITTDMKMSYRERQAVRRITPKGHHTPTHHSALMEDESDEDLAERFLRMLNRQVRAVHEYSRMDVGMALFNVFSGSHKGLELWRTFCDGIVDSETMELLDSSYQSFITDNNVTLKTLAWYARIDRPDDYADWHRLWTIPKMIRAAGLLDCDVAEAFYRCYWLDFVCASVANKRWYMFSDHRWKLLDRGVDVKAYMSGDFKSRFEQLRTEVSMNVQECTDPMEKGRLEAIIKGYSDLIKKLGNNRFKATLLDECQGKFHDDQFCSKLDSDPSLVGVMNAVVQTCSDRAIVRDGKPEDFVSKKAFSNWDVSLNDDHPVVKAVQKWFNQMFPDPELCHYAWKLFSSFLFGRNAEKIWPVLSGGGDNSKSMLKKGLEATLGPYVVTLPTSILSGRRTNSSGPSPELAQANGSHVAFLQEPDADDAMKGGVIKELTGGDSFFARFLNENGGSVTATFTLVLLCNKIPIIPNCDKAVKNRMRVLPFLSTWVKYGAPKTEEEQMAKRTFPMDKTFERRIPGLARGILYMLVKYYAIYKEEGLVEPKAIVDYTTKYWDENDPYHQFITRCIEAVQIEDDDGNVVPNTSVSLDIQTVVDEFTSWYKRSFTGVKCPLSSTIIHEISARMGEPTSIGWSAIRIKQAIPSMFHSTPSKSLMTKAATPMINRQLSSMAQPQPYISPIPSRSSQAYTEVKNTPTHPQLIEDQKRPTQGYKLPSPVVQSPSLPTPKYIRISPAPSHNP
uniref:SF3 helicase domain-containing protein n=1 Tax=viral metagenome TaxID=1070528 RepID=A0A6C0BP01_9ZZZZ